MNPEIGDIAWVEFDPAKGTEQAGRRPALVLSHGLYHRESRRAIVCPITTRARIWSFNLPLPNGMKTRGFVLVDQVRTVDRVERMFEIVERAPDQFLAEVRGRLGALLGFDSFPVAPEAE